MLALVVGATPLTAQFPAVIETGTRVRVAIADSVRQLYFHPPEQWLYGTVVARAADTLYLALLNVPTPLAVPRASVRALSVSRGLPSPGRNAIIQGARHALLGALVFYELQRVRDDDAFGGRGGATLVGATVGATLGVYLGARQPVERWHAVPLGR